MPQSQAVQEETDATTEPAENKIWSIWVFHVLLWQVIPEIIMIEAGGENEEGTSIFCLLARVKPCSNQGEISPPQNPLIQWSYSTCK